LGALPPIFSLPHPPPPPTTTSHPYTTHQRVLGSRNGGLERVGRSRGFGKREGPGKDTGKSNQPPLCIPAKEPPPPPLSYASPTPPRSLLPKAEPFPMFCLLKPSPGSLVFGFLAPTSPPSCHAQSHHPTVSNPVYPTPTRSPLPEKQPPCILLAKAEPRQLSFGI
jgi:hypothetical protein